MEPMKDNKISVNEPEAPAKNKPELQKPERSLSVGSLVCAADTEQGAYHIKNGNSPCQDFSGVLAVPEKNLLLLGSSDGVGRCALSQYGSCEAVKVGLNFLKDKLETSPLPEKPEERDHWLLEELLPEAFRTAQDAVEELAEKMDKLVFDFMSTLDLAIYDGQNLWYGHCGDGGIVVIQEDGTCRMVTRRHKGPHGDNSTSVIPLQGGEKEWEFGKAEKTAAVGISTDGILDIYVRKSCLNNEVFSPFLEGFAEAAPQGHEALWKRTKDILKAPATAEASGDDLTMVVAVNQETWSKMTLPPFDVKAWQKKEEEYNAQVRSAAPQSTARPARPAQPAQQPAQTAWTRPASGQAAHRAVPPQSVAEMSAQQAPQASRSPQSAQDAWAAQPAPQPRSGGWKVTRESVSWKAVRTAAREATGFMADAFKDLVNSGEPKYEPKYDCRCCRCGNGFRVTVWTEQKPTYCPFCGQKIAD